MNRAKAETIADRILARMEQDGDGRGPVAHRESIIEEIIAGDALDAEQRTEKLHALGEPVFINGDLVWEASVIRDPDGSLSQVKQEGIDGAHPKWTDDEIARMKARPRVGPLEPNRIMTGTGLLKEISDRAAIQKAWRDMLFTGAGIYRLQPDGFWSAHIDDRDTA